MTATKRQHYPKSIWTKKVLIPFWVIELLFAFVIFVFSCITLTATSARYLDDSDPRYSNFLENYRAGGILALIWALAALALAIAEIVLFSGSRLGPKLYLIFACVKTTGWLLYFLITLFSLSASFLTLIFVWVLMAIGTGQTIYGGVIFHRLRKGKLDRVFDSDSDMGRSSPAPEGSYAAYNPRSTRLEPMASENPFRDPSPSARSLATSLQGGKAAPPSYDPTRVV